MIYSLPLCPVVVCFWISWALMSALGALLAALEVLGLSVALRPLEPLLVLLWRF